MAEICRNCKAEVFLNYCANCGQQKSLTRIDGSYIVREIRATLSFEKGFLYTIRELAINPGQNVRDFLNEDRNRLVKPILFLILTSLIYSVLNRVLHFEDGYIKYSGDEGSASLSIFQWIQGNYGYANIVMALFIGAWTKLFFRKHGFNIFEILVLLCFTMGMGMLIYAAFGSIQAVTGFELMQIAALVGFVYLTWAIGQFYGKRKFVNYIKAFFAYVLGMITFSITAVVIGMVIDLLLKQ